MSAAYDSYDYVSYWLGRGYEHNAEVTAIKGFLSRIKKINTILEVGAGFGRLTGSYSFRARKVILSDPSSKLLKLARDRFRDRKQIKFVHSSLENLSGKVRNNTIDLIVMVRVIHHIKDLDQCITILGKLLRKNGYLILEYPNKRNLKAVLTEFFRGNFTFPLDIFPKDLRSKKSIKKNYLPFYNYHPDNIEEMIEKNNFKILEKRSVSNMRSGPIKKVLSTDVLVSLEKILQKPLAVISFGPSIFILAKKIG